MIQQDVEDLIKKAKNDGWRIVLYGLGILGRIIGIQLLEGMGLTPDFVCDRSNDAIDSFLSLHTGIKGMNVDELLCIPDDTLVLVCVGVAYIDDACQFLSGNPQIHMITIDEACSLDCVLESFYGVQNIRSYERPLPDRPMWENQPKVSPVRDRMAVYTCITGGYDVVKEPACIEKNCDYYLISDVKPTELNVFHWIDVRMVVPENIVENAARNRWCKMNGHRIFPEHRYSFYMDGSAQIVAPVSSYIELLGKAGIAVHKHPHRNCIYEEGIRVYASRRGNLSKDEIVRQMKQYILEGMPRDFGLFECTMIVRDHCNQTGNIIMEKWFKEYMCACRRDQLCFTYILWKNGIAFSEIGILNHGEDMRKNSDFVINEAHGT